MSVNKQNLEGKSLIITGAASGFGLAASRLAAGQGAKVIMVDRSNDVMLRAAELGDQAGSVAAITADIQDDAAVEKIVADAFSDFGSLDGLFANAGVLGTLKPFSEMSPEDWLRTLQVNVVGTFNCVRRAASVMAAQGHGSIVCTESVAGLRANAGPVDYSASKAAIISMVQTIAYELYGSGVRINAVCPGLVETGMTSMLFDQARSRGTERKIGQVNPSARPGKPEEIAELACFLLSDAASYINGQAIAADGGLSASHPWVYPQA